MGRGVMVIGNFDGVHLGHQALLALARSGDGPVTVVTFWPHPMTVIRPDLAPRLLCSLDSRLELLRAAGADDVRVVTFDEKLATASAEEFFAGHIAGQADVVMVGENFRFGHRAGGDVQLLHELCSRHDMCADIVSLHSAGPGVASSTAIRAALDDGDVTRAHDMLGRAFAFDGTVVRGKQRGRAILGIPTANLAVAADRAVPADGVYAGWTQRLDVPDAPRWPSAISVGTNPTFGDVPRTVESYIVDREDLELYDVPISVEFTHRLRGMVKFEGLEGLRLQMEADVRQCRSLLNVG